MNSAARYLRDQGLTPDYGPPWNTPARKIQLARLIWHAELTGEVTS